MYSVRASARCTRMYVEQHRGVSAYWHSFNWVVDEESESRCQGRVGGWNELRKLRCYTGVRCKMEHFGIMNDAEGRYLFCSVPSQYCRLQLKCEGTR
jgi:hypothetical protein